MADALILELKGRSSEIYKSVNGRLGIDTTDPSSDWPAGLLSHCAGEGDGTFFVIEVWDSKASQERFMAERLGPALQAGGALAGEPPKVTWVPLLVHTNPAG